MSWKSVQYKEVRKQMKPGDIIAFSGKGHFSEIIKWATRSPVSHVGIILQSKLLLDDEPQAGMFNQIIESATINGFSGVSISRLSDRIDTYHGEMWWLPLSDGARNRLDTKKFFNFMLHQDRKEYDLPQALNSAMDALDDIPLLGKLTNNNEDFSRFFCSELAAAGLEAGGVIGSLNASEVTPIDLCKFNIFADEYHQIKGGEKRIGGFNSLSPEAWGE